MDSDEIGGAVLRVCIGLVFVVGMAWGLLAATRLGLTAVFGSSQFNVTGEEILLASILLWMLIKEAIKP